MRYFIQYEFKKRFDPQHSFLKQAIRTALACFIALIIYRKFPQYREGYWVVLTTAFIIQARLGDTRIKQVFSVLLCGAFAAVLAWVATIFYAKPWLLALYLAVTSSLVIIIGAKDFNWFMRAFYVNLFAIMSGGLILQGDTSIQRFWMIILGTVIASLCSLLWLASKQRVFQLALQTYLHTFAEFLFIQNE